MMFSKKEEKGGSKDSSIPNPYNTYEESLTGIGPDGKLYKTYDVEYEHEGSCWSVQIKATSFEDALARIRKLRWVTDDDIYEISSIIPVGNSPVLQTIGKKLMNGVVHLLNATRRKG